MVQFRHMRYMAGSLVVYGERAVHEAGIAVLGYPGLWATENFEAKKIHDYLNQHSKERSGS
jgi:hypothetical protein